MTAAELKQLQILQQLIELSKMGDNDEELPETEINRALKKEVEDYLWNNHSNMTRKATTVIGVIKEMIENLPAFGDIGVYIEEEETDDNLPMREMGYTDVYEDINGQPGFVFQFDETDYVEEK